MNREQRDNLRDDAAPDHMHEDIRRLARLLDDQFVIPGTGMRFGLDGLLGLVPGVGDLAMAGLSAYIIARAVGLGAPTGMVLRMLGNAGIDLAAGSIPLMGDLFDIAFKANRMNINLLEAFLAEQAARSKQP